MNTWNVNKYLIFIIVCCIFVSFLLGTIYYICKKNKKSSKFFMGLIIDLKVNSIISLSLIIINFLYLGFCLIFKMNFSLNTILISDLLVFLSFIFTYDFADLIINLIINSVNISLLYLASLVVILRTGNTEIIFYILQILMNFFGLLFYMFTSLKFLKNICKKRSIE